MPDMGLDPAIGRGDNAPDPMWSLPFAVAGSDFVLTVTSPTGPAPVAGLSAPSPVVTVLTVSGGGLALDTVANTVTWPISSAQSQALPYASTYTLRRVVTGGEERYYAAGRLFAVDGPVGSSLATVTGDGTTWLAPSADLSIGRGDNAPSPTWAFPFDVTGSDFALDVAGVDAPLTVSGGGLFLDPVAHTVTWPITSAESAALEPRNPYTLRRIAPEVRTYAAGLIFGVDGPVRASQATVQVTGPQGPQGDEGPAGPKGPQGETGPAGGAFTAAFPFPQPSTSWPIAHGLNRFPSVTVVDTANSIITTAYVYADANNIIVSFNDPTVGTAYLN